jgi:hypothetical protein
VGSEFTSHSHEVQIEELVDKGIQALLVGGAEIHETSAHVRRMNGDDFEIAADGFVREQEKREVKHVAGSDVERRFDAYTL